MSTSAPVAPLGATTYPAAELDRRFYAFVVDRLVAWGIFAGAAYLAWRFFLDDDEVATGVGVIVATIVVVSLVYAVLLGVAGLSPGKALVGLRVVRADDGRPIGVSKAVVRTAVLGMFTLPTLGLGLATLAWTAVMDPGGRRRGGHDRMSDAVVVDVRPAPVAEAEDPRPRAIVNLTAMRLMPTPVAAPEPAAVPARVDRPASSSPAVPPTARPSGPAGPPVAVPAARSAAPAPAPAPYPRAPRRRAPAGPARAGRAAGTAAGRTRRAPGDTGPRCHAARCRAPRPAARDARRRPRRQRRHHPAADPAPSGATTRWRVTFDTGETFVVEGLALVGRRPEPRAGEPVTHLVPLRSSDMSLSKTHAQFQVVPDGALVVMDRGSTNGSVVVRQGVSKSLTAGRPSTLVDGDTVRFGDRTMTVAKDV